VARVFVTAAGGFIGSHLVERLVADGHDVRALVEYSSTGSRGWLDSVDRRVLDNVEIVAGAVRDGPALREAMRGADRVMHLAALIAIPYSYKAPASYIDVNVQGTLNVVQAATELSVARIVHTSTSEV